MVEGMDPDNIGLDLVDSAVSLNVMVKKLLLEKENF